MIKRRTFLKAAAVGGVGAGFGGFYDTLYHLVPFNDRGRKALHRVYGNADSPEWLRDPATGKLAPNPDWTLRHTVDLQCHSECGLRVKINRKTGRVQRIIGNPYHSHTLIDYAGPDTPLLATAAFPGTVCARGNAGIQTAYDPYRITVPLKRKGARGSGQWQPISWEQLIKEVTDGGKIFADTGDPASQDIDVLGFKGLYAKRGELMNPDAPELGHRTNGYVFEGGRIVGSRKAFALRFNQAFGSVNCFEHTNICEVSHHVATAQVYPGQHMTKPDVMAAEFIIYWGTQPGDANFPMQLFAKYAAQARAKAGGLKYVVVDPLLSRGGVMGDSAAWLPIKPGTDGALALAMIRWIIENGRYNADYLSHPTQKAAEAAGELSHTDAAHLVVDDPAHAAHGRFLTAKLAGVAGQAKDPELDRMVIDADRKTPVAAASNSRALVEYTGTVNGIRVKSAFTRLREAAAAHTIEQYAEICGIGAEKIVALAREFTSHGRKAVCEAYRGPCKHPNGYYNTVAILLLNLLVGNSNWTGGLTLGGGGYPAAKGRYDVMAVPAAKGAAYGVKLSREEVRYEDSSEYKRKVAAGQNPYPAKRPWFPLSFDVFSDLVPSAVQRYPYGVDILFWMMATPFYSVPGQGNDELIAAVKDPKNIPLIIACDIVVGDTSMYADYIVPDGTFLEYWTQIDTMPTTLTRGTGIRWPVIELTEKAPDGRHMCLEEFLIDVAKRIGMPGYGANAIPDAGGRMWPLHRKEDWYLKATANVAFASGGPDERVLDVTAEEMQVNDLGGFRDTFKATLKPEEWPKALSVLAKGGRFEPHGNARQGDKLTHRFTKTLHFYAEEVALTRNSMTGEPFLGTTTWVEPTTALGTPLDKLDNPKDWPLTILTFKGALQTHSRLASNYVLRQIMPVNGIQVAAADARRLGIRDGEQVWVVTPHGKRKATAVVIEGLRPGVITFNVGYGHWGYGATNYQLGGKRIEGDRVRRAGIHLNPIMRRDPGVEQMALMDVVGGSVVFFNTRARLEKDGAHV
ncbi:MAG: tetrathionate reductase subunit TtrA [Alphaproteobacteria bacterium]|nr:tetrathionate reductase subunit TtrA [Alphaproteobacteria bacterium]